MIKEGDIGFPANFENEIGPEGKHLILSLLEHDPDHRLGNLEGGARDVRVHPWFKDVDFSAVPPRMVRLAETK